MKMAEYEHPLFTKKWQVCIAGAVVECHDELAEAKRRADHLSVGRHERVSVVLTKNANEPVYMVDSLSSVS